MTTLLMRHGRTALTSQYIVNGDPSADVSLDDLGIASCVRARAALPVGPAMWFTSRFRRTHQTAQLLAERADLRFMVLPELDELDYGRFEGQPFVDYAMWLHRHGPHALVPGGMESQRDGIARMLSGLVRVLATRGPRVVICHGLLVSALAWQQCHTADSAMPLFFPEAKPAAPWQMDDDSLRRLVDVLAHGLEDRGMADPGPSPADWARAGT